MTTRLASTDCGASYDLVSLAPAWNQAWASRARSCHVFFARLQSLEERHLVLLDEHELARRARFRWASDRDRFALGGVLLRAVVAEISGVHLSAVTIDRTCPDCGAPHGRPQVVGGDLEVSISHSGDVVAVAVTEAGPVGVDIEIVARWDYSRVLGYLCTPAERRLVRGQRDFYALWTRKEAILKATGEGLRRPMTEVVVAPPGAEPELLPLMGAPPRPCRMADVSPNDGYAGAVAVLTADPIQFIVVDATGLLSTLRTEPE